MGRRRIGRAGSNSRDGGFPLREPAVAGSEIFVEDSPTMSLDAELQ